MTDTKIRYNEFEEDPRTPKDLGFIDEAILDLADWPRGAKADGKLYRIGWCQNQRALMQNSDHHPTNPELGVDGEIQWVSIDPRINDIPSSMRDMMAEKTGTYLEMSRIADALNNRSEKFGNRPFVFYPHPLELAGQR